MQIFNNVVGGTFGGTFERKEKQRKAVLIDIFTNSKSVILRYQYFVQVGQTKKTCMRKA